MAYVWGSVGLDEHARLDGLHSGGDGARLWGNLGSHQGAEVVVVGVDETAEVASGDGQGRALNDRGAEGTSSLGANVLADAEGVGCDREFLNGDLGGARGTVGEGDLGVGNGGNEESGNGDDELHLDGAGVVGWGEGRSWSLWDEEKKNENLADG